MAPTRKATRNAAGRELTIEQVLTKYEELRRFSGRIPRQHTLKLIRKYYSQGEIMVESTKKVSLICPVSKRRIEDACRGEQCLHLECFDIRSYLQYHTQLAFWECPVCDKNVSLAQGKPESRPIKEEPMDVVSADSEVEVDPPMDTESMSGDSLVGDGECLTEEKQPNSSRRVGLVANKPCQAFGEVRDVRDRLEQATNKQIERAVRLAVRKRRPALVAAMMRIKDKNESDDVALVKVNYVEGRRSLYRCFKKLDEIVHQGRS